MTARQKEVFGVVFRATLRGQWHRARSSGERVTLASLYTGGALERRVWRGEEGAANAAHEYKVNEETLRAIRDAVVQP